MASLSTNMFSSGSRDKPPGVTSMKPFPGENRELLEEYKEGRVLTINMVNQEEDDGNEGESEPLDVTIQEVFRPATQSVVMKVSYVQDGALQYAVLKLYDRRGSIGFRTANGLKPGSQWTHDLESRYQEAMQTERGEDLREIAYEFVQRYCYSDFYGAHEQFDCEFGEYKDADILREAVFAVACQYMMEFELAVYEKLEPIQGVCVPDLYANVVYSPPYCDQEDLYFQVHGILMECFDGVRLCDLYDNMETIPVADHQKIGELALETVEKVSALGVLNCDVSVRNAMAIGSSYEGYRVVIYDFGIARVRQEFEDDASWWECKWLMMEVDKLGLELMDVSDFQYECVKPFDESELDTASEDELQQQELYKRRYLETKGVVIAV